MTRTLGPRCPAPLPFPLQVLITCSVMMPRRAAIVAVCMLAAASSAAAACTKTGGATRGQSWAAASCSPQAWVCSHAYERHLLLLNPAHFTSMLSSCYCTAAAQLPAC